MALIDPPLSIANAALGLLPAKQITAINEASLSAQKCRQFYPSVVQDLLAQGQVPWDFSTTIESLAPMDNPRSNEWLYAYAVPANMGSPIRILPAVQSLVGAPYVLGDQLIQPVVDVGYGGLGYRFKVAGGMLFCDVVNAQLEFARTDPVDTNFTPLFRRAVELELAVRICPELLKSDSREKMLMARAAQALSLAMADNFNRSPQRQEYAVPEALFAREGFW